MYTPRGYPIARPMPIPYPNPMAISVAHFDSKRPAEASQGAEQAGVGERKALVKMGFNICCLVRHHQYTYGSGVRGGGCFQGHGFNLTSHCDSIIIA